MKTQTQEILISLIISLYSINAGGTIGLIWKSKEIGIACIFIFIFLSMIILIIKDAIEKWMTN
jgi:hypothetical protein